MVIVFFNISTWQNKKLATLLPSLAFFVFVFAILPNHEITTRAWGLLGRRLRRRICRRERPAPSEKHPKGWWVMVGPRMTSIL